jgi:hypothetical protein
MPHVYSAVRTCEAPYLKKGAKSRWNVSRCQQQRRSVLRDRTMIRVLLAMMAPAVALAQTASCSQDLPENSITATKVPAGWVAASPNGARLSGGGMLSGNPKEMNYLVPASWKKVRGGSSSTWKFTAGEEKWFYCAYGRATIELSKRMDDKATTCIVASKDDDAGALGNLTVTCR